MSEPIRFHADENIGWAVIEGLRRRRIEVSTKLETGLTSATGVEQLTYARETGRVFVTQDTDFLRLHAEGEPFRDSVSPPGRNNGRRLADARTDI